MNAENETSRPLALEQREQSADKRLHSPSAARNKDAIRDVLKTLLPTTGRVIEIGCGTGEHSVHFAAVFPELDWLPSDPDAQSRDSASAWIAHAGLANVRAPVNIDVREGAWGVEELAPFNAIVSLNMIHIAPWAATLGLFAGAERLLASGGVLFLYGPFMRNGEHTAPSNAAFDVSLKTRDPSWGVRDVADLERLAQSHGLALKSVTDMPANNFALEFRKN